MTTIKAPTINIKELNSKKEIALSFPILTQHHQYINKEDFLKYIDEILEEKNYQMIGAYIEGELVGISGYWILTRFYSGKYVQVGNMVVNKNHRNLGIGKNLLQFIENEGKKQGCQHFILDSRMDNKKSHEFYLREGFEIMGYHFMKDI
ncbi:MAG: GNAT superfamily N-acetyltransferase [Rickettsiales bacterium]|jgi:GNAT superfamily N-acetyltransferase